MERPLNTISMLGQAYSLLGFQIVEGVVGAGYPQKPKHSAVFAQISPEGSRLTERGIPTPNLFTGMQNIHGPHEFVSVQDMSRATEMVEALVQFWGTATVKTKPGGERKASGTTENPVDWTG